MELVHAFAPLELKSRADAAPFKAGDGPLWIRSLISTPSIDSVRDIVEPGAFAKTMPQFIKRGVMLFCHDMKQPCGKWTEYEVSEKGVILEGFVSAGRKDVQELVLDGSVSGSSIGYKVVREEWDEKQEANRILELWLGEASLVPLPANDDTSLEPLMKEFRAWSERARPRPTEGHPSTVPVDLDEILVAVAGVGSVAARVLKNTVEMTG